MFARLLLQWFWDTYDALGRLAVLNLVLFTVFLLLTAGLFVPAISFVDAVMAANLGLGLAAALLVFTLGGALVLTLWFPGLLYFSWQVSQDREFRLRDFMIGLRESGGRFLRFSLLACFVLGLIAVNGWFYARDVLFSGSLRMVGAALAGLCFWLGVLWVSVVVNAMPWLVREPRGLRSALKLGAFVTLRYPLYSFGSLLFLGLLWLLSAVLLKTAPLWILGLSATGTYINSMHDVAFWWEARKDREARQEEKKKAAARPAATWKQVEPDEEGDQEPPDRYQRTLRDILKPWE